MRPVAAVILIALLAGLACDKATPIAPSGATITLTVSPEQIGIDGEAAVTAILRKEDGSPVNPGTEVRFSTTRGEIVPETAVTNDRGIAEAVLRGTGEGGTATVTATSGAASDVSVEIRIGFVAASIILDANPANLPLEGGVVELIATVRDDQGQLLKDIAVNFDADTGVLDTFAAVPTNASGIARNRLTVSAADVAVLDDFFITVSAFAATEGGALLEDITEIGIFGGVAFISLQATPSTVPESGASIQLLALVQDDIGEPVEGAGVNFFAEVGTLVSGGGLVRSDADGEAIDILEVSEADLLSLTARTFQVGAETIGLSGEQISEEFTIRIQSDAPIASFSFDRGSATNDFLVAFSFTGSGEEPLIFLWEFGDGGTSNLRNPNHDYTAAGAGTYSVTLTVTDTQGRSDSATASVTVPLPAP